MDPQLNGSCDIPKGLRIARKFLGEVLDLGIPTATELLDPITPQYLADSLCWAAIGARTSESQTHRQMASGLSMPVGFKNATVETLRQQLMVLLPPRRVRHFGNYRGWSCLRGHHRWKPDCQLILRGGSDGPNYTSSNVEMARIALETVKAPTSIMIDRAMPTARKIPRAT